MSKNNNNRKANVGNVSANISEVGAGSSALQELKEAAPVSSTLAVLNEKQEELTQLIRPAGRISEMFREDGETVTLVIPQGQADPDADEFATYIGDKIKSAERSSSHAAFALWEVAKRSTATNPLLDMVKAKLNLMGISQPALANVLSVANRVIPVAIKNGYKAPPSLLKDAVAMMVDKKSGDMLTTPASVTLQKMFSTGLNPDKCIVLDNKGNQKDVSGQPITTTSVRAVREWFGKDGEPEVGKHPEHPEPVKVVPTPVLTTEQRSASASNATDASNPTGDAPVSGESKPVLVDEKKPDSAGSSPVTSGKPTGTHGTLSEAESIAASLGALAMRAEACKQDKGFGDSRNECVTAIKRLAKVFGGSVSGV